MIVVLAWVRLDGSKPTGRYLDRYGLEPEFVSVPVARACVWTNEGGDDDVRAALAHLEASQGDADYGAVYAYESDEADPLGRARGDVLSEWREGSQ